MKPLYIMTGYSGDVRRERASADEIRDFIDGRNWRDHVLVYVVLDNDGNLLATPLSVTEIDALRTEIEHDQETRLVALLDGVLALARQVRDLEGVMWSPPVCVWPENAPHVDRTLRAWAFEHELTVEEEPIPSDPKCSHWIRWTRVSWSGIELARCQWPSVRVGTVLVAIEAMCRAFASFADEAGRSAA